MYATNDEIIRAVREWQEAEAAYQQAFAANRFGDANAWTWRAAEKRAVVLALRLPPEEEAK